MAKPFYSLDEVCALLGKNEADVRAMVLDGTLREYRDAGKVFFRAEDLGKLTDLSDSATLGISLEPADGELPSLGTDPSGGTSVIGLAPVDESTEVNKKEGTVISNSGISAFDDDELEIDADPMAETHVHADAGVDQISLEGSGGGSGLIDLPREADDTSLGAELLDEIYPGEEDAEAREQGESGSLAEPEEALDEPVAEAEENVAVLEPLVPTVAVAGASSEGMFAGLAIGALLLLVFAGSVGASLIQNFNPDYAVFLSNHFWAFLGGAALLPVVSLLFGWLIGRASAR